jgi:hypothetical protein
MSQKCHNRTHAPQQTETFFDRCVGADEQRRWHREAEWTAFIWERTDWRLSPSSFFAKW